MSDLPNYMQRRGPFDLAPILTFECRYGCGALFPLETSLKAHEVYHTRLVLRCPYFSECKYSTFAEENLQDHIESFHYNTNRHKCSTCDFAGPNKASLTKHRKAKHGFTPRAVQAKNYTTTRDSQSPISIPQADPDPLNSPHPHPSKIVSGHSPSLHVSSLDHATSVGRYPPPIRALDKDVVNWPTTSQN